MASCCVVDDSAGGDPVVIGGVVRHHPIEHGGLIGRFGQAQGDWRPRDLRRFRARGQHADRSDAIIRVRMKRATIGLLTGQTESGRR